MTDFPIDPHAAPLGFIVNPQTGAGVATGGNTPATPLPDVQGRCPACGGHSLMLAEGGYITCRRLECPDPEAAHQAIEQQAAANAYSRAITTPPSAEACAAIRERLESGNPPRRKVRTTPDSPATSGDTADNPLRARIQALADEHPVAIPTNLIDEALDQEQP